MKIPNSKEIRTARERAGLTQAQAAELVHYAFSTAWGRVEQGLTPMPMDKWELFLIKTNQHPQFKRRTS